MAEAPRADGFEWGMTALPALEEGGDRYSYTWFEQAWIPSGAEHIDAGKQFIAFLYSDVACEIFAAAGAIQPVLGIADSLEGDNKLFYSIYDNGAKAAMGNFAAFTAIPGVEVQLPGLGQHHRAGVDRRRQGRQRPDARQPHRVIFSSKPCPAGAVQAASAFLIERSGSTYEEK